MDNILVNILCEDSSMIPEYQTQTASGADLKAFIDENIILKSGESTLVNTGIKLEIPVGFEIQIRPRSGLALKHQITVLNTPGTIDSDYRGEIKVILINHSKTDFTIEPGMRIAQMVLSPVCKCEFVRTELLSSSERNHGGFGHTGKD